MDDVGLGQSHGVFDFFFEQDMGNFTVSRRIGMYLVLACYVVASAMMATTSSIDIAGYFAGLGFAAIGIAYLCFSQLYFRFHSRSYLLLHWMLIIASPWIAQYIFGDIPDADSMDGLAEFTAWITGTLTLVIAGIMTLIWNPRKKRGGVLNPRSDDACAKYGHLLHGNVSGICPECGMANGERQRVTSR